jgi:hypothetical protein
MTKLRLDVGDRVGSAGRAGPLSDPCEHRSVTCQPSPMPRDVAADAARRRSPSGRRP